jgi:hypothetical protein
MTADEMCAIGIAELLVFHPVVRLRLCIPIPPFPGAWQIR